MKKLQQFIAIVLLLFATLTIQSCSKDDTAADQIADTTGKDDEKEDGNSGTGGENSGSDETGQDDEGNITLYRVEGSDLVKQTDFKVSGTDLEFQKDIAKHDEIWDLVKKIVPESYFSKMSRFMIFSGQGSGVAGYVFQTAPDLSKWEMGIAIDFAYEGGFNANGELAYTIIHEFGHILTLDNTQVDSAIAENACENYFVGEGCSKKEAYINKSYQGYWADIWPEYTAAGDDENKLQQFYEKHRGRFVTNYASTNPAEDIAEVFATFVTRNGGPNGDAIAEKKIQLMYDHPELIQLRNFIRSSGGSSKKRAFLPAAGSWKNANRMGHPKKGCTHRRGHRHVH